jgi:hypothetical protein
MQEASAKCGQQVSAIHYKTKLRDLGGHTNTTWAYADRGLGGSASPKMPVRARTDDNLELRMLSELIMTPKAFGVNI